MTYAEARMEKPETRGRKKLHHMRVHVPEHGHEGHMITHHAEEDGEAYKTHHFHDGGEALAHIAKHAKMEHEEMDEE
jgi:hypothetical protein